MIATHSGMAPNASDSSNCSRLSRVLNAILSDDPKQRATIRFLLISVGIFLVLICTLLYGASINLFDPQPLVILANLWIGSVCVFYAVVRSGLNQRYIDKTLSLAQICTAQTLLACAYTFCGDAHAGILIIMTLITVFGMFNMRPHATYLSCTYTLCLIGMTMWYKAWSDPGHYQPAIEWIFFVLTATSMFTIGQLSICLGKLRVCLKQKKTELEQAYLHIQNMATHDELTGLYNRRELKNLFLQYVERQARNGQDFYLAMIDIDHFKLINDTYGHHIGDEALVNLSAHISELLRKTDTIGRWGGEEFLLLLPDTGNDLVRLALGRLHARIAGMPMVVCPPLFISFSAGLTKYCPGESIDEAVRRVDQLLYLAKSRGRNQIVHDEVEPLAA